MKKYTRIGIAAIGVMSIMLLVVLMEVNVFKNNLSSKREKLNYIDKTVFDTNLPVVSEEEINTMVVKPYVDGNVKVARDYYDSEDDSKNQENSILYYGYTYMQNEGIDYSNKDMFDVVAVLDGKVLSITNDEIYGNTLVIDHSNGIVSKYQFLSKIDVKKDEVIKKGTIIGKSGTSRIDNNEDSYLHFELLINDKHVDPDLYFNKPIGDI